LRRKSKFEQPEAGEEAMCKGFELDEPQKQALRDCIVQAALPQKSRAARVFSRVRAGLTMFVIGLHSGRARMPERYDPNNRIL
jgi:hypothetical protein